MTLPATMRAMVTMGHGGLEQMVLHEDWPCPIPSDDDVLNRVGACGLNNTDVNTRSGWYSKTVTEGTTGGALTGWEKKTRHGVAAPSPFHAFKVPMFVAGLLRLVAMLMRDGSASG